MRPTGNCAMGMPVSCTRAIVKMITIGASCVLGRYARKTCNTGIETGP
jgi:hypothetical protein